MPKTPKAPRGAESASSLKRENPGRYRTLDGRFTVEQASGRWMVLDAEQTDDLGLALVRGPFATLDEARGAIETARSGPQPTSDLAARIAALPPSKPRSARNARQPLSPPEPPPIGIREWRPGDGVALRRLWDDVEFRSIGDDDASLAALARRNPGLLLVATAGETVIASALGAWDGRRGWIYHVATARDHRRTGIGRRLVAEIEERLRVLGCRKVNVIVREGNDVGAEFWRAIGYALSPARQFGRELPE
jgi:GNAT superfamily N-acetyltransferase